MQSHLDKKLRRRGLRLIRKICEARGIVPSSYVLQEEHVHVGKMQYHGGFADVSDGVYQGRTVAIKCLKTNRGGPNRIFKVLFVNVTNHHCSAFSSGCVERLSSGNTYPTQTSYLCWGFPSLPTCIASTSLLSGWLMGILCSMQRLIPRQTVYRWQAFSGSLVTFLLLIRNL